MKFFPVQVVRRLHGQVYLELSPAQKRIVDAAMETPTAGRRYEVALWNGCVEVLDADEAVDLWMKRREKGMVRAQGGLWSLPRLMKPS